MLVTAGVGGGARAADPLDGIPYPSSQNKAGQTAVGVRVVSADTTVLSFEVPLYVTVAVLDNQPQAIVPNHYGITNTSKNVDGTPAQIAVTGLRLTALAGRTWQTASLSSPTHEKGIYTTIGGAVLPQIRLDAGEQTVEVDLTANDNRFYDTTTSKYRGIGAGYYDLPLTGTVKSMTRANTDAAAQFKLEYSISLFDTTSNTPIGSGVDYNNPTP